MSRLAVPLTGLVSGLPTALTSGPQLWYLNRATGLVLLALFTLSTVLGVLSTARVSHRLWPRFATQTVHRNVALLSIVLLAAHVATAVLDTFVDIRWYEAFVPRFGAYATTFAGITSPVWLWLGTAALDLFAAVTVTSLVRRRMGHGSWRRVHLLAYGAWVLSLVHGLGIGTDRGSSWAIATTLTSVGLVAVAVLLRLATAGRERALAG